MGWTAAAALALAALRLIGPTAGLALAASLGAGRLAWLLCWDVSRRAPATFALVYLTVPLSALVLGAFWNVPLMGSLVVLVYLAYPALVGAFLAYRDGFRRATPGFDSPGLYDLLLGLTVVPLLIILPTSILIILMACSGIRC